MASNQNDLCGALRREVVRAALERFQGMMVQNNLETMDDSNAEDPKGIYEVEEMLNIPYMNRSEVPLAMDIFKPKISDTAELPVIVTIHGGGLVLGDRKMSRKYATLLAKRGYLVFSIEYRLAPRANAAEQLDDVCAGMDLIGRRLVDFNVDFRRVFLTAESAGAYLAIYVAAMNQSKALQEAIGYKPTRMKFKALGLFSGMFYTNREDLIGWLLSEQFYGDKKTDPKFLKYMDPENPEIIDNLPPTFLVTSQGDFLNNYTLMFHDAMKEAHKTSHMLYYGEKDLGHAFVTGHPGLEQSIDAIDQMTAWFEEHAGYQAETKKSASTSAKKTSAAKSAKKETAKKETAKKTSAKKTSAKKTTSDNKTAKKTGGEKQ